jgi:DnaJ-class molecular chaperone
MEREPSVQIREPCEPCDGTGKQRVEVGAGHARWAKRIPCPECDGTGRRARWIALSELRVLLERPEQPE